MALLGACPVYFGRRFKPNNLHQTRRGLKLNGGDIVCSGKLVLGFLPMMGGYMLELLDSLIP